MASSAITGPVLSDVRRAPAGTAAAPSFAFNDSTGTGVYLVSAGVLGLSTAGVQRVVVDASGRVGIGGTPIVPFEVVRDTTSGSAPDYPNIRLNNQNAAGYSGFYFYHGTVLKAGLEMKNDVGALVFATGSSSTERMRIDASGNLLVGASTAPSSSVPGVQIGRPGATLWISANAGTASYAHFAFLNANGVVGSIAVAGLSTAYNTNSDYRLKEDVQPMVAALSRVAALKPCTYKWKADGSEGEGFIAHELAEVCPTAVTGEKDAVNEDGSIKVQGIDPSKLVGLLVAAIQELEARLAALEAK